MTPKRSASPDRARPQAADRAMALALGVVVLLLAAAPALGGRAPLDGGGGPGPSGGGGADVPRPVATRPAGRPAPPASARALAVRGLRVPLATATRDGIAVSFVPRPGSLVADVRLVAGGRLVLRRLAPVPAGRRATVRLRAAGLRPGAYEVTVRAGAGRATLGPAVGARVVVG